MEQQPKKPKIYPGLIPVIVLLILVFASPFFPSNWEVRILIAAFIFAGLYSIIMLVKRLIKKERPIWSYILAVLIFVSVIALVIIPGSGQKPSEHKNSGIKAGMSEFRVAAEFYYDDNQESYAGLSCDSDDIKRSCHSIEKYADIEPIFYVSADKYCAHIKLLGEKARYWCVDDSGFAGYGQCDEAAFTCFSEE